MTTAASPEAQLKSDYADLGVSTGYIGNIYYGPVQDDRSFRVFTQVLTKRHGGREERDTIQVFDVPYNHKGIWADKVEFDTPAIRTQLDALRAQVAAGTARLA